MVIGGVGGSGTRIFAELMQDLGIYMGSDLNESLDNLAFTLLFKRPGAFKRMRQRGQLGGRFDRARLGLLSASMTGQRSLDGLGYIAAWLAYRDVRRHGHDANGEGVGEWADQRWSSLLAGRPSIVGAAARWGWKEPNSHLYLPMLLQHFRDLRYIHVLRHGLDMAFSRNVMQMLLWGPAFGIGADAGTAETPLAAFEYWTIVNQRVDELAAKHPNRVLLVRFEDLCQQPVRTVKRMADFVGMDVEETACDRLAAKVEAPTPLHRYPSFDYSTINAPEKALKRFGYAV